MGRLQELASQKDNCILFGDETLDQAVQRAGRWPIPAGIQDQVGQSSEQSDPVEDGPVHCREVGL